MWNRVGAPCSACIEAQEIHGFGDGGQACECEFEYRPAPKVEADVNYILDDEVTWKRGHKPVSVDWNLAVVESINYEDEVAEVAVLDGASPYYETLKTEHVWTGALCKA